VYIPFFLSGLLCDAGSTPPLSSTSSMHLHQGFLSSSSPPLFWKTCQASAEQNALYRLMLLVTRTSKTSFFFFYFSIFFFSFKLERREFWEIRQTK
jgi:hypothetical protein